MKNLKLRLIVMNFLEFAVWGAYLTSMGGYLATHGLADNIGWFYAVQGSCRCSCPHCWASWPTAGFLPRKC